MRFFFKRETLKEHPPLSSTIKEIVVIFQIHIIHTFLNLGVKWLGPSTHSLYHDTTSPYPHKNEPSEREEERNSFSTERSRFTPRPRGFHKKKKKKKKRKKENLKKR